MNIFGSLKNTMAQYADVYLKLLKLNVVEKTSSILSYIMFSVICMLLSFCTMLLLAFGLVEVFCALGVPRLGSFFITISIYVIFLFIMVGLRKNITRFFAGVFIRIMTEENKTKKDND